MTSSQLIQSMWWTGGLRSNNKLESKAPKHLDWSRSSYEFLFCNFAWQRSMTGGFLFSILRYRSLRLSTYCPKLQNGTLQSLHPENLSFKLERLRPSQAGLSSLLFSNNIFIKINVFCRLARWNMMWISPSWLNFWSALLLHRLSNWKLRQVRYQ